MGSIKKENGITKVGAVSLRLNLSKLIKEHEGESIYITKRRILVAELNVYTQKTRKDAEINIARILVENSNKSDE